MHIRRMLVLTFILGALVFGLTVGSRAQDKPDWMTIELMDAQTGEAFTLADFEGKTVLVEPMATWCSTCRRQLGYTAQLIRALMEDTATKGDNEEEYEDQFVFIALSVETNLAADTLARYAERFEFPLKFAVMNQDMLRALVAEFGRSAANPPSSPSFIIRADGTFTELKVGVELPEEILANLETEAAAVQPNLKSTPSASSTPSN
ncbi:MAG: hypothetical protein OHK0023_11040 [Anaerolineae bacterium]